MCNILVATQPLVSVWELLMGVGETGKLPILLLLSPQSISWQVNEEKGLWPRGIQLGEKVTLEKKERYLHFAGTAPSWCQCAV